MLTLEIDHLLGVAFAAQGQDSVEPDWPPQPDRVFSALVAAWGARGERDDELEALTWLEALPPPRVAASRHAARPSPVTFVPPNDPETGRVGNKEVAPPYRRRQPRRFPAALPHDPLVQLVWDGAAPEPAMLNTLNALARDTAYVGHSASLTRCRFLADGEPKHEPRPARRHIYPGRFAELTRAYTAEPRRRPSPGVWVEAAPAAGNPQPQSVFGDDWIVFEIVEGSSDLRAAAPLGKLLLKAVMSGYGGGAVPAAVSGHEADGAPTAEPHLAVIPLANLGWSYSDGALFGFALVPPRAPEGAGLMQDPEFHRAMRSVLRPWGDGARALDLSGTGLKLQPVSESLRLSLGSDRYSQPSRTWATATPIVLDRHLKTDIGRDGAEARQKEIEEIIRGACANIGLAVEATVVADKHSAIAGAPSAYPSGRAPGWTGWRVPEPQRSRALSHAVIRFSEPVQGPLILGAGRFCGLGLCLPLDDQP